MSKASTFSLSNIPVVKRIHAITLVAVIGLIALSLAGSWQLRQALEDGTENDLRQQSEIALGVIKHFYGEAEAGRLTTDQAKNAAFDVLSAMRFDNGAGYFFVDDLQGMRLMNPVSPQLVGTNGLADKGPDGQNAVKLLVGVLKDRDAAAVRYAFAKPGKAEPQPKITYGMTFRPWNWFVATGAYVDEIDEKAHSAMLQAGIVVCIIAALTALVATLLARGIVDPLRRTVTDIDRLAAGDLETDIAGAERQDEIGRISRGLVELKRMSLRRVELEAETAQARHAAENERRQNEAARAGATQAQNEVVEALAAGLEKLSNGDLTFRLQDQFAADYEKLRSDFNATLARLEETMRVIATNTEVIRSGTDEIATAADDLSRRTEQQAASLEETAAALDEITATVRKTAEGSTQARDIVTKARTDAERSRQVVNDAVTAMSGIEKSAHQINQIIGVIDEIAFQTNLLALNAGVEAARAGDAGRGFAVVASEVRALAQRSAEAAKEIKGLISTSGQQVDHGVALVGETGAALERIVAQVSVINDVVAEIAASAGEQATGLHQVNRPSIKWTRSPNRTRPWSSNRPPRAGPWCRRRKNWRA